MFTISIQLPDFAEFKRAGADRSFALTGLDASIIAELVVHGMTQKVGDAASGKEGDEATAAMLKVHDALVKGDWGVKRGASDGLSATEKAAFQLYVDAQPWGKKVKADDKRAQTQPRWDAMADADKQAWLDEARDEADRAKAAEERRARLAASLQITV